VRESIVNGRAITSSDVDRVTPLDWYFGAVSTSCNTAY
jgi:hypothetical protein